MKVLRLYGNGDLRFSDEKPPTPRKGEELLRVAAVGICGSDIHWFSQAGIGDAQLKRPLVLGHEFAAITAADGRLVGVDPGDSCGKCDFCQRGYPNLCPEVRFAGHGEVDGALREMMCWPKKCLFDLPEELNAEDGVMLEPLGVAVHAIDLAHFSPNMRVGIFGCGPIGLLIIQLAALSGAQEIVATDRLLHRVEAAESLGADLALQVDESGNLPDLEKWKSEQGLDVVFETAGDNAAVENAIWAVKPGGRVVLVGIPEQDRVSFSASAARRKGLNIVLCRRSRNAYPRAISLSMSGKLDLRSLITHRFPFSQAQEAFQSASKRVGIKTIIEF